MAVSPVTSKARHLPKTKHQSATCESAQQDSGDSELTLEDKRPQLAVRSFDWGQHIKARHEEASQDKENLLGNKSLAGWCPPAIKGQEQVKRSVSQHVYHDKESKMLQRHIAKTFCHI